MILDYAREVFWVLLCNQKSLLGRYYCAIAAGFFILLFQTVLFVIVLDWMMLNPVITNANDLAIYRQTSKPRYST